MNQNYDYVEITDKDLLEWKNLSEKQMRVGVRVVISDKLKKANSLFDLYAKLFNAFLEYVVSKGYISVRQVELLDTITEKMLLECAVIFGEESRTKIKECL